jgi:2-methylcitrate dehydratase PrpD
MSESRLTPLFAHFVAETQYAQLPERVRHTAKRCLLDHLGCVSGGMQTELAQIVTNLVRAQSGVPQATLLAPPLMMLPATAVALAHGTAANALDYDDTLVGHPGATVAAAALAAAELVDADGPALLAALVAGYEVCSRLMHYWQPRGGRFERVWDTATLQTFGAAAAAGSLLDLNPAQIEHAFGIAAATAPIPRVRTGLAGSRGMRPLLKSTWGWAAQAGLQAALLARTGLTGQELALDGESLIWQEEWAEPAGLAGVTDKLGQLFLMEQIEFKPYPACRFLHAALDALSDLMVEHRLAWQAVERVAIAGFSLLGDAYHNIPAPSSRSEAQFSTPYSAAALLYFGELTPASFAPEALENPELLQLARRVEIGVDPRFEARFPRRYGARVSVTTGGGQVWENEYADPRGTAARPLDDAALMHKFAGLFSAIQPETRAVQTGRRLLNLERETSMRAFMAQL